MTFEEKRAWILALVSVVAYVVYAAIVGARLGTHPVADVPYVAPLLWTVGGSIVASIVLGMVVGGPRIERQDQRDREIGRFGEHIGQSLVVTGGVAALLLALLRADYFWIANVLYLGFVLSALLGSIAKIFAYRRGFHPW